MSLTAEAGNGSAQAAAMDRMYRLTRHVYDASRKFYLLGRDETIDALAPPEGGTVLEMGCGTGRNLVTAARRWPKARFYGFDISEEMLKTARASIERAGLADRIEVAPGDATAFDPAAAFGRDTFDRVYFSYTLSMIPDWRAAVAEGLRLTGPEGRLSIVDFGGCERLGPVVRRLLGDWLALFHVTPRLRLEDALRDLAAARGRTLAVARPYRGWAQTFELR